MPRRSTPPLSGTSSGALLKNLYGSCHSERSAESRSEKDGTARFLPHFVRDRLRLLGMTCTRSFSLTHQPAGASRSPEIVGWTRNTDDSAPSCTIASLAADG